jgi:hypothetical protein
MTRCITTVVLFACGVVGLTTAALASEPQRGTIRSVTGICLIVREGSAAPFAATAQGYVVAGDLIYCQAGGELSFSLPGSGRLRQVLTGETHLVLATPRLPEPAPGQGKIGGRTAQNIVPPQNSAGGLHRESRTNNTDVAANSALETCERPLGTVALSEDQSADWYDVLRNKYRLPPSANLLRFMVQQSNCFVVVERESAGANAMSRERALRQSGELRAGSNFGAGQMVASDYALFPSIIFNKPDAELLGSAFFRAIGGGRSAIAGAAGGVMVSEQPNAILTLIDNRSGVQVVASEGHPSAADIGALPEVLRAGAASSVGRYSSTSQGQTVAASFVDAFNQMVITLRSATAAKPDALKPPVQSPPAVGGQPTPEPEREAPR